jgi:hypothetical protein
MLRSPDAILRRGQGNRAGVAGRSDQRRHGSNFGQRRRHHAPDRRRHAVEIQGDDPGGSAVNFLEC